MSARKELETLLTTDWADIPELAEVRVIATERDLDDVQVPTALIRTKTFQRAPYAPLAAYDVGVLLTLISPHIDADQAADDLDDRLEHVTDYLGARFRMDPATAVGYGDRLAFDIPLTLTARKEG